MSAGLDSGELINAGALLLSALAARWARRAHRDLRPPQGDQRAGELLEEVASSQREMVRLFTAHVASDERFETEVRRVLRIPKARQGIHQVGR